MSGALTAAAVVAATATVYSANEQRKAGKAQERAANEARTAAGKQADLADQANNRANKRRPSVGGLLEQNMQSGAGGAGSTMLTGPGGADAGGSLGKNTLLGQ